MDKFELKIPYTGEQISTFKTISDMGSLVDSNSETFNLISDEEMNFFKVVTLGFYRLNMNGTCLLIDKDFDNLITIFNITSNDKRGKGKLDSTIRISLKGEDDKYIYCDCELTRKGFIKRLDVDLEKIFSPILSETIEKALQNYVEPLSSKNFIYEPLVSPSEVGMDSNTVESLDVESLTSLVSSGNIREAQAFSIPLWVKILQLPANIILSPIRITRKFLFDI
ncbi:MAG: hypothetical protein KBF89_02130 [Acidimicrobiia bacterium]|nr:hypothetical protein [Acidimicrobiia bacterium]